MPSTPLTAAYTSGGSSRDFSSDLPPVSEGSNVQEKTAYLNQLRSGASKLQADINTFLTQKMEQDKASETAKTGGGGKKKVTIDEDKEEEMYGEEDPENDG